MRKLKDVREWIEEVEKIGELCRVTAEVDPDVEMGTLNYMNGRKKNNRFCFLKTLKVIKQEKFFLILSAAA